MYINYVSLMLFSLSAGLFLTAGYVLTSWNSDSSHWAPPFLITGLISFLTGFHMIFTWPLPGSYNIVFGDMSVIFGGIMLAASFSLYKNLDVAYIAFIAGLAGLFSILISIRVYTLEMTQFPALAALAYILLGVSALLAWPVAKFTESKILRNVFASGLILSSFLWLLMTGMAYWGHLFEFAHWQPGR